jgi:hypothetical protein
MFKCEKCEKLIEDVKVTISHTEKVGKIRKIYKLKNVGICCDCFEKEFNNRSRDEDDD